MRVICINSKPKPHTQNRYFNDLKKLIEGKDYTVIEIITTHDGGYLLEEVKSSHTTGGWPFDRFIPCSDIDETELINEKELTA